MGSGDGKPLSHIVCAWLGKIVRGQAMTAGSYNQYCPTAMAAEILCSRWTILLLRELLAGSMRFNQLRRGVPRMSPALISKRLKDLEEAGIVIRRQVSRNPEVYEYSLSAAGLELKPIIEGIGVWGHRWVESRATLENLDPNLLMWDIRRNITPGPLSGSRRTIEFIFQDQPKAKKNWWLVIAPDQDVDLCSVDPGHDVDLYLVTSLRRMTEIWMGYTSIKRAISDDSLVITGDRHLRDTLDNWFTLNPFAGVERCVG